MKVYAVRRDEESVKLKSLIKCSSPIAAMVGILKAGGDIVVDESVFENEKVVGRKQIRVLPNGPSVNLFFWYEGGRELQVCCEVDEPSKREAIEKLFDETVEAARMGIEEEQPLTVAVWHMMKAFRKKDEPATEPTPMVIPEQPEPRKGRMGLWRR